MLNKKGQILPLMFTFIFVLMICFFMIFNFSELFYKNMQAQNAADNTALSVAAYRARVLNYLGKLNRGIGAFLYGGGSAEMTTGVIGMEILSMTGTDCSSVVDIALSFMEWGVFNFSGDFFGYVPGTWGSCANIGFGMMPMCIYNKQSQVTSIFDMGHNGCDGRDWCWAKKGNKNIKRLKENIELIISAQDLIKNFYPVAVYNVANQTLKNNIENASFIPFSKGFISLGLKRNKRGVNYKQVYSACSSCFPIPFVTPGWHTHGTAYGTYKKGKESWLYADKNEFDRNHKITVLINCKFSDKPFGAGFLGNIKWPGSMTAFASAATYNTKGPMFPLKERDDIREVFEGYKKTDEPGWMAQQVADFKMLCSWVGK